MSATRDQVLWAASSKMYAHSLANRSFAPPTKERRLPLTYHLVRSPSRRHLGPRVGWRILRKCKKPCKLNTGGSLYHLEGVRSSCQFCNLLKGYQQHSQGRLPWPLDDGVPNFWIVFLRRLDLTIEANPAACKESFERTDYDTTSTTTRTHSGQPS
jgi:hypothetical protein